METDKDGVHQSGFPRFQYSEFIKNGRDGQFVVRGYDWETFKKDVEDARQLFGAQAPVGQPEVLVSGGTPAAAVDEARFCDEHQVALKLREMPNGAKFWDHRRKNEAGVWQRCYGKGKGWETS